MGGLGPFAAAALACFSLLAPAPAADAQAAEPFVLSDREGDVTVDGEARPPVFEDVGFADLRRVEVTDDEWAIQVRLIVGPIREADDVNSPYWYGGYRFFFSLGETPFMARFGFSAGRHYESPGEVSVAREETRACIQEGDGCSLAPGASFSVSGEIDEGGDAILLHIQKADLPFDRPQGPPVGEDVHSMYAVVDARYYAYQDRWHVRDRAPDTGTAGPYALRAPAVNRAVRVNVDQEHYGLHLAPGIAHTLDFNVTNRMPEKRIYELAAGVAPAGGNASHFEISTPRAVTVPASSYRRVQFQVNVSASAPEGATTLFRLRAKAVATTDEEAKRDVTVWVSPTLTPTEPMLYLQSIAAPTGSPEQPFCYVNVFCFGQYFWSTHKSDPRATGPRESETFIPSPQIGFGIVTERMGAPVYLDRAKKARVSVSFSSRRAYEDVPAEFGLAVQGREGSTNLVFASESVDIVAGRNTLVRDLEFKGKKPTPIAYGDYFTPIINLWLPMDAFAREQPTRTLYLDGTYVTLPVVAPPPEALPPPPSAFQLRHEGDHDRFLNAGETAVYKLTLLNQLGDPQIATLASETLPPGWGLTLEPGARFELMPGDLITVHARLRAPPDAPEGAHLTFNVTATDESGRAARALARATVLTSVEVDDQAKAFPPDPDANARLLQNPKPKTPSLSAMVALTLVGFGALWRRRAE